MALTSSDFPEYFSALYRYPPMPWQIEVAEGACIGQWHDYISLPTGAGKTSTIDIAVFALAVQAELPKAERTAAMRTFLVVDRRTVVNEAFKRAERLKEMLIAPTSGILKTVADQLRLYGGSKPLEVTELRGGIYRDPSWCDSLTQPMIVTSTVDQVGSRLLFRGYGVSNSSRPMQAAAIAHDSLLILDEAHISKPFAQTLQYVRRYQQTPWCNEPMPLPMRVVEMTATPQMREGVTKLEVSEEELLDPSTHIGNIVNTPKRTTLEVAENVKGTKAPEQLAKILAEIVFNYVDLTSANESDHPVKVVGVMVNTVATAKATYRRLCNSKNVNETNVHLIVGAMRPIDRDTQSDNLRDQISTGSNRSEIETPIFVVATQCIEVGADYDFDMLVTEAAPISSLVQRFGRLNRAGRKDITAVGHIVMRGDRVKTESQLKADDDAFRMADPIYGNAISYSWNWLAEQANDNVVDFGIAAFRKHSALIDNELQHKVSVNDATAPVLLPSHLDLLCQTTLDPHPNPDVSLWLHGPQRNDAEVQVCWRADLIDTRRIDEQTVEVSVPSWPRDSEKAIHTVSLCPPSASECMSVRLVRMKNWLSSLANNKKLEPDSTADISGIVDDEEIDAKRIPSMFCPVAWRGTEKSVVLMEANDIRPGDTLVFSIFAEGWDELGFIDNAEEPVRDEHGNQLRLRLLEREAIPCVTCDRGDFERIRRIDKGTEAFTASRNRRIVRIHPTIGMPAALTLLKTMSESGAAWSKADLLELINLECSLEVRDEFRRQQGRPKFSFYDEDKPHQGLVITGNRLSKEPIALPDDDGSDFYSRIEHGQPVPLKHHCENVLHQVQATLEHVGVDVHESLRLAAARHDWGKADPRFQAMLLAGDPFAAYLQDELFAKSDGVPLNRAEQKRARERSELPSNFRHELLSVLLIDTGGENEGVEDLELLLHVVASHHGFARPWPPRSNDSNPPDVSLQSIGIPVSITTDQRELIRFDAIDSPIVFRFWRMTRKYGWWGIAYLESILRFADRRASQIESQLQATGHRSEESTV